MSVLEIHLEISEALPNKADKLERVFVSKSPAMQVAGRLDIADAPCVVDITYMRLSVSGCVGVHLGVCVRCAIFDM